MATSRLQVPQLRVCPPEVLDHLREVDPSAELVYMGDGVWMLGSVSRTSVRERAAQYKLRKAAMAKITGDAIQRRRKFARWRFIAWEGALLAQGFAPIQVFGTPEKPYDPDSRVVEYLRERNYCWASQLDAAYRRSLAADDAIEDEDSAALSSYFDEYKLREGFRRMVKTLRPARGVLVEKPLRAQLSPSVT